MALRDDFTEGCYGEVPTEAGAVAVHARISSGLNGGRSPLAAALHALKHLLHEVLGLSFARINADQAEQTPI
jgi:hypothetical protein